jgi:hypothetical protein
VTASIIFVGFTVTHMSAEGPHLSESWAPESCTLPVAQRPVRAAQFDELFSSAVLQVHRPEPERLELELDPTAEVAASTAALAVRETACCSFFAFTLRAAEGRLLLEVAVPSPHIALLDALAAHAVTAVSDGRHRWRS